MLVIIVRKYIKKEKQNLQVRPLKKGHQTFVQLL